MNEKQRWLIVVLYAVAMAWVESAVVFYLRTLVGRLDPYQPSPLPKSDALGPIELVREAATLLMLLAVGWLAGRTWRSRLGYTVMAFGVWDIFYYVFLKLMCGWPRSLWDWDVLFLLPLPWWGPVIAPVSIAVLMIVGGTLVTQFEASTSCIWPGRCAWRFGFCGVILALYVFMADAIQAIHGGEEAIRKLLPTSFNWTLFLPALLLMAWPILDASKQIWRGKAAPSIDRTVEPIARRRP